jgi:hypothetical protein
MNWFDSYLNRTITKILRIDSSENCNPLQPYALFIMFDKINGLLISATNDGKSIQVDGSTLNVIYDEWNFKAH